MNSTPTRLSDDNLNFLKRCNTNRIKVGSETKTISYSKLLDIIEKYFKDNNDEYLNFIKWERKDGI